MKHHYEIIANDICTNTYRGTSEMIKEHTGIDISAQGVWNIVQEAGEKEHGIIERYAELAAKGAAQGKIETQLLYLENDGVFLTLQGKDRKKYGSSHEMKVGIAYDGVKYTRNEDGKITRRTLDTKVAYATMNNSKEFERKKKGLISSVYSAGDIDLIVKNGDGSSWIQKSEKIQTISVLDKFHRNKKVRESVRDAEEVKAIMTLLNNNETEAVVDFIEERLSVKTAEGADYNELKKLSELLSYFSENQEALSNYYSRGIEIPPTRSPELHHARLGSMESNIFTLIGNRMKHRRCCWSIAGANNLAILLCRKYANGLDDIFMDLPELTGEEIEEDFGPILSHRDATARVGSGYEYPYASEISSEYKGIKLIAHQESFGDLFF